ncbi:MAG TPA: PQQ-binding-like beta-propeller repeat protein [Pirellulaceae bacterium]|nr:PQQ-binding-like beta-propeller repeat protein [Pirellulaceae bacterium]
MGAAGAAAAGWLGCGGLNLDQPPEPALAPSDENPPAERAIDPRGWPCLFGPELTSVSRETGLRIEWPAAGPPLLWQIPVGTGYSSPVLVDDDLIVLHRIENRELLSCFDAESGQPNWEHDWPTSFQCKYAYSSGPYGTPLIDGDVVFAAGAQGRLVAVSRADGALIWERDLQADRKLADGLFGFGPGFAIDAERFYLNAGGGEMNAGVIALDKRTGETLWTATDHAMAYTTPRFMMVAGRRLLLVLTKVGLTCLDPATGDEHWTYEFHSKGVDTINAVAPAIQDNLVLLVAGPGPGSVCLRIRADLSYEEVWKDRRVLDSQFNTLVHEAGHIYGFTARRQGGSIFKCLEFATGKLRWEYSSPLDRGQAIAADGRLILLGEHGLLTALALDPARLQVISTTAEPLLASPCYSSPALHRGLLYLRNESRLLCLRLRVTEAAFAPRRAPGIYR